MPNLYKVTFLPEKKEKQVDEGATLFEAAEKSGVYLNSLCGGEGVCGKCRVQIIKGNTKADNNSVVFFSKEEIQQGYVLACQTQIFDDLEVVVPPESRLEEEQILMESHLEEKEKWIEAAPITYSEPDHISLKKIPRDPASLFEPSVSKFYLELPEPTVDDNTPDTGRITRELGKRLKYPFFEISLSCLREMSRTLRRNDWKVTVTVSGHNNIAQILQIEGGNTADNNYGIAVDIGTTTVGGTAGPPEDGPG